MGNGFSSSSSSPAALCLLLSAFRYKFVSSLLPSGYRLLQGSGLDRPLLVKFMQRTYREMEPRGDYAHLAQTVEQYFSRETPLWWVERSDTKTVPDLLPRLLDKTSPPIACLWLGTAIDQIRGDRHTHIFLLYVAPEHRRQGIGSALMHHAETWAKRKGRSTDWASGISIQSSCPQPL
ncbi:GNAT family N-acetyltransferase [Kovacikia minuta]|uniref:GNAT family N-acetyltransferase n=1 Tax=Kovacikia minuta TaxID=2931930 RepID=UPI0020C7EF9B